jgi:nuclear RNA export factor
MFASKNTITGNPFLQEKDSIMNDSDKKGVRGRGPNKYNGKYNGKSSRPISERLGNGKQFGLKKHLNKIKERKGEFQGKDNKGSRMQKIKNFSKSRHERVIASNVVGNITEFEKFIRKKSKKPIKILRAERKGENIVCFTVENMGNANSLVHLSGIKFNGNTVTFAIQNRNGITTASDIKNSVSTIDTIKRIILSRYNQENEFLNLENLKNDPMLGNNNQILDLNRHQKLGQVICKLIKENIPQVKTISFANNNLNNLKSLEKLHEWLPDIQNLSFENNNLNTLRDIEPLKGESFKNLRELVIAGNPIKDNELRKYNNFENLKNNIKSMFPSLILLDQEELPEGISFDVGKELNSKVLPIKIKSSFIDSDVTATTIQDFIIKYFNLFDTNRIGLLDLYDDNSMFSLSVNNNCPSWRKRHDRGDNMSNWKLLDRNFKNTRHLANRDNLLIKGKNNIIQAIGKLPSTKHPLEDDSKFIVDSWQVNISPQQVLIYLNISGEFQEVDIKLKKSFSRTFLIAPSQPQSNAAIAGWPYTIYNDQITVRPWSGNKSFDKAEPNPITLQISNTIKGNNGPSTNSFNTMNKPLDFTPLQLQEQEQLRLQHGLNELQHQQVQKLSSQTHLTYSYSLQCLNDFKWDYAAALDGFQRVKVNIFFIK